jgi:hypothetical protein
MTLQAIMQMASLVLAIGVLVWLRWVHEDKRVMVLVITVTALAVLGASMLADNAVHYLKVRNTESKIIATLGTKIKSYDDLSSELYYPDHLLLSESLDDLMNQNLLAERMVDLKIASGQVVKVRAYCAR